MKKISWAKVSLPLGEGENINGAFKIEDDNVAPFLRAGDYVLIQAKYEAKEYRAGEFCVVSFEGKPAVRQVWWKDECLWLWDFTGRVDAYAPDALNDARFIGTIVGLYRPMPYKPPIAEGADKANG